MLRFVYERALEYVKIREQFGKPLIEFQAVQLRIADMAIQLEAARLMATAHSAEPPTACPVHMTPRLRKFSSMRLHVR